MKVTFTKTLDLDQASLDELIQALPKEDYSEEFAVALYGALCNQGWRRGGQSFSCSWRAAGDIVADWFGDSCYLEYYCAGGEGQVTDEVKKALGKYGWEPCPWEVAQALVERRNGNVVRARQYLGQAKFPAWFKTSFPKQGYTQRTNSEGVRFQTIDSEHSWQLQADGSIIDEQSGETILPKISEEQVHAL